jgi:MarR family transcriptional regulator for hemolysin
MHEKILGKNLAIINRAANLYLDERLSIFGINRLQAEVLIYIGQNRARYQNEINGYFCLNKATITKIMSKLEKKGMILRLEDEDDKRKKRLILTAKAMEVIPQIKPILDEWDTIMYSALTNDVRDEFNDMVSKVTVHVMDYMQNI